MYPSVDLVRNRLPFLTLAILVLGIWCGFCLPAHSQSARPSAAQRNEFPIFPTKRTQWHENLSSQNSDVTGILNNRPIGFNRITSSEIEKVESSLQQALQCAQYTLRSPRDVVDCYSNLGCVHFISHRFLAAHRDFEHAISEASAATNPESTVLAPILDLDGMALRAAATETNNEQLRHDYYEQAQAVLLRSLQIRTSAFGFYHPDVAHSLMNLSLLYHDRALDDVIESPSQRTEFSKEAHQFEIQVDELMNPRANRVADLLDEAYRYRQRSILFAAKDPDEAWKCKDRVRVLLAEADSLKHSMVMVNGTDLSHNPPCPRPSHTCLTTNSGADKLGSMLSFADSIINRCKQFQQQDDTTPQIPQGFGTIIGTWYVPSDITVTAETVIPKSSKETPEGVQIQTGKGEHQSQVANQEIFLLSNEDYAHLYSVMEAFAKRRGLTMAEFRKTWPANNQQSLELLMNLQKTARDCCKESTKTDEHGDYHLGARCSASSDGRIPEGKYFLYASLLTNEKCYLWFLPGYGEKDRIEIKKAPVQKAIHFTHKNSDVIWVNEVRGQ